MNKTDLVGSVADKTGMTKRDVEKIIGALLATVEETLKEGERVQLVGFGTFEVRDRKSRKGRNPQTGQEIDIPATKVPAFKAGKALKDAVV